MKHKSHPGYPQKCDESSHPVRMTNGPREIGFQLNQTVYAPDADSSGRVPRNEKAGYDSEPGRVISFRRETPDDYLNILKPQKGPKRMVFNPDIPKTLTPRGYAKLKLVMNIQSKKYETLVRRLLKENKLFEDEEFPANNASLGKVDGVQGLLDWKRPREINPNASLFAEGVSRFDIEQGALGDCWFLAVVASIASYPQLFEQVVPKNQALQGQGYCGAILIRFWRFGKWEEVIIDDRLPVYKGRNQLAFMHSRNPSEFWSALVEKAYAKVNGTYGHLSGGSQSEAMEDLTGGVCQTIELDPSKRPKDLLQRMQFYEKRCCLMGCSIDTQVVEQKYDNGLIGGHAYSVTGLHPVNVRGTPIWLIRLRNPWGDSHEWRGPWSDNSPQWKDVSEKTKQEIHLKFSNDGEFWMSFDDFVKFYSRVEVCFLGLESLEYNQDFHGKRRLEESIFSGQWQKNVNAGGCINNRKSYWTNPQYRFTVEDPDPDDNEQKTHVIVALMQKDIRRQYGADFRAIGFMLYDAPKDQTALLSRSELLMKSPIGKSSFINTREVSAEFRLTPGSYVVIPSTFEPNLEGSFILRIFSQVAIKDRELDDDNTSRGLPDEVIEALKLEDALLAEDEEIEQKFIKVRDPTSQSINATQLGQLLNESTLQDIPKFSGFNKELCRSMVAAIDNNLTGQVELNEFMELWIKAKGWKHIFVRHDVDQSGYFNSCEFREALQDAGFLVSNRLFNALVKRYEDPGTDKISFEDFMLCMTRLKTAFDTLNAHPKNLEGVSLFNDEDFLRFSTYI